MSPEEERQLRHIEEITRGGRVTWIGLLVYLVFVSVTLMGVEDADFFLERRQTELPFVGVAIPTNAFFIAAPAFGAALYIYLQIYLIKLWEALSRPKAWIGGERLGALIFPFLASDWALARRADRAVEPRAMLWLARFVTWLLIWVAPVVVLGWFWWQSATKHDEWLTLGIGACVAAAFFVGLRGYLYAHRVLGRRREPYEPPQFWRSWAGLAGAASLLGVTVVGWARTEGGLEEYLAEPRYFTTENVDALDDWVPQWVGSALPFFQFSTLAPIDLADVEITPRPADWRDRSIAMPRFRAAWCRRRGIDLANCHPPRDPHDTRSREARTRAEHCGREGAAPDCMAALDRTDLAFEADWRVERDHVLSALAAPDLRGRDMRGALLMRANLVKANLSRARMERANLFRARMEGADLSEARMGGANLSGAQMEGTSLIRAAMEGANLSGARMEGANLLGARMQGAILIGVELKGADLFQTDLAGADLSGARIEGAMLRGAHIGGANLNGARIEGADFFGARMEGANLSDVRMEGADLLGAVMEGANLSRARMKGAVLRDAQMERADLREAQMEGVNLRRAQMERVDLRGAQMVGVILRETNLRSANMRGAHLGFALLMSADFRDARFDRPDQLRDAVGDNATVLPKGVRVGSCFRTKPPEFERMLDRATLGGFLEPIDDLRARLLCTRDHPALSNNPFRWIEGTAEPSFEELSRR